MQVQRKTLTQLSIPICFETLFYMLAGMVDTLMLSSVSDQAVGAVGTANTYISVFIIMFGVISSGMVAVMTQNIGAGKKSRAWKGFYTAIITGCSVGIIIFMVGFFGGGVLSSFFTNDSEVIAQSAAYLKGFSADCILTCVLFSSIGYFNGCGKSIPVMIQGITSAFCIRIPVSIIMSRLPETSLTYVGMATPITTVYGIIFFVICFRLLNKNSAK